MNISISGRHMEVTDALRAYIEKKIARLSKFHHRISEMEVVLGAEGQNLKVELIVKADHHQPFVVHQTREDAYACVDEVVDKIERQLRRHKEKSRNHKGRVGAAEATADLMEAHSSEAESENENENAPESESRQE